MRLNRALGALAIAVVALSACEPSKGKLLPLEEALTALPKPMDSVAAAFVPSDPGLPETPIRVGNRHWMPIGNPFRLPQEEMLRPVATLDGLMFHSFAWDQEPFDRLFVRSPSMPGMWVEYRDVQ